MSIARRRGYVLLAALAVLVLAATLMVGFSRAAFQHMVRAKDVQDELQTRWGEISCRKAVLPYAGAILASAEQRQHKPLPAFRIRVLLGRQTFDLILSDEQAKANLNLLLDSSDVATVENRVRQTLTGTGLGNRLKLRPALQPATRPAAAASSQPAAPPPRVAPPEWVSGLGQVFGAMTPEQLISPGPGRVAAIDLLTCWGDGSINLNRVPEAALKLAAVPPLSGTDVSRLIGYRDQMLGGDKKAATLAPSAAGDPTAVIMKAAGADDRHRLGLTPLTGTSTCFSLWIVAHARTRDWFIFTVLDASAENEPRTASYVW